MNSNAENSTLVVVPAYNAAEHLSELVERLRRVIDTRHLLIVNDGSTDGSPELLESLGVNVITFSHNRGKGAALAAGYQYARKCGYGSVLSLDADLQHAPEEIPQFFGQNSRRQVIMGTRRMTRAEMPLERLFINNLTSLIISVFSTQRIRDSQSGFRLLPVTLLQSIRLVSTNYDFESELLFKAGALGYEIVEAPVSTIYRASTSFINPFVDTLRFIRQLWKRIWI